MKQLTLSVTNNTNIFFTSDCHFGHRNVLNFCHRPFESVKDMEKALIANWNAKVTNMDIVFVQGDFMWFDSAHEFNRIVKKLNGMSIYFISGNHDNFGVSGRLVSECPENEHRVQFLGDIARVFIKFNRGDIRIQALGKDQVELTLSHYPLTTWVHREQGVPNLFGHIHSGPNVDHEVDTDIFLYRCQHWDVGVDNNNYAPIELVDVFNKLKNMQPVTIQKCTSESPSTQGVQEFSHCEQKAILKRLTSTVEEYMDARDSIEEVLKNFDFQRVHKVMTALNWKWATCVDSDGCYETRIPTVREMEQTVRNRMVQMLKKCILFTSSGGFQIRFRVYPYNVLEEDGDLEETFKKRVEITVAFVAEEWSNPA